MVIFLTTPEQKTEFLLLLLVLTCIVSGVTSLIVIVLEVVLIARILVGSLAYLTKAVCGLHIHTVT